jgi:hypothetical protein
MEWWPPARLRELLLLCLRLRLRLLLRLRLRLLLGGLARSFRVHWWVLLVGTIARQRVRHGLAGRHFVRAVVVATQTEWASTQCCTSSQTRFVRAIDVAVHVAPCLVGFVLVCCGGVCLVVVAVEVAAVAMLIERKQDESLRCF